MGTNVGYRKRLANLFEHFAMAHWILIYLSVIATILVIDGVWLGLIAKRFYADQLGSMMRKDIKALPAVLFYLLFAVGLVIIAVRPEQDATTLVSTAIYGGLVGFIAYGTYNMTNYATLKGWPVKMTLVDWPWGTGLSALASAMGGLVKNLLA